MKHPSIVATAVAVLIAAGGCAPTAGAPGMAAGPAAMSRQNASAVIAAWPETSREVAQTVIGKYGAPD